MQVLLSKLKINTCYIHANFTIPLLILAVGQVMTSKKQAFLKVLVAGDEDKITILTAFGQVAESLQVTLHTGDKILVTKPKVQNPKFQLYGLVNYLCIILCKYYNFTFTVL